ncbi:AlpA family transcriptional regulator [Endozoicomonas sp. SCSIO W0465]|uniref:helix-turn-helix transcriptional regulator n=1 Tax=Endozoicomonas sp. SCSIO W0465 TaxID=2918516 RepID=UPI0020764B18|nr:hypothetical protein [Endozoicomonas sp. SCSIO W0465]USE36756.1 hypothetical protein MJO57_00480 [Endozoicomonas sp. SCSIO W0465]
MEQKKLMRVTDILREYHLSKSTLALIGLQTVPRLNLAEALIIKGSQSFARQFALKPYIAWSTSNFHCRAVRKSNRASTFYKIIRNGEFPEPVSLGKGIQKLYRRSDVEAFFGC